MIIQDFNFSTDSIKIDIQKEINSILNQLTTYNPKQNNKKLFINIKQVLAQLKQKKGFTPLPNPKKLDSLIKTIDMNLKQYPNDDFLQNLKKEISSLPAKTIRATPEKSTKNSKQTKNIEKIVDLTQKLISSNKQNETIKLLIPHKEALKEFITHKLNEKTPKPHTDLPKQQPKKTDIRHDPNIYTKTSKAKNKLPQITQNIKNSKELNDILSSMKDLVKSIQRQLPQNAKETQNRLSQIISTINKEIEKPDQIKIQSFEQIIKKTIEKSQDLKISFYGEKHSIKHIGNITNNLNKIAKMIQNSPKLEQHKQTILNFTKSIEHINLKENIQNSGILYESKIAHNINDKDISNNPTVKQDIKGTLIDLKNDIHISKDSKTLSLIDKTLTQIESFQANSLISSTFVSYIPFLWDGLKEGSMQFDKLKKEDSFSCKIELSLEKYGDIHMLLLLNQNSISISIEAQNKEFENRIKNDIGYLKKRLNAISLKPNIFFANRKKDPFLSNSFEDKMDIGMDFKI